MNANKTTARYIKQMLAVTAMAMAIPMVSNAASDDSIGDRQGTEQQQPRGNHGHHGREPGMKMLEQLNLTDAQKAQVKQIMASQKADIRESWKARKDMRKQLDQLTEAPEFDKAKADQLIRNMQDSERLNQLKMLEARHQIYMVLTPEQRAKAHTLRTEHEQQMRDHMPPPPPING